jgi:hypothetical protein
MSKTVTQEITEFRDAIKGYDSANLSASLRRIVSEGFDVLGKVKNLADDAGSISEVSDGLIDGLGEFVDKALANRPVIRRSAPLLLSMVVPGLVADASKYTDTVDKFWDEKIEPVLAEVEAFVHEIRADMMG